MKKIVGLVVVAVIAIWFTVTLQTGKTTVNYLTEQLEEVSTLYSDILTVELEWQKKGWRTAEGILRVRSAGESPTVDVQWTETFQLTHGFLRSRLTGHADFRVDDWLLSDYYGEQGITSSGVFSARGGAIEYVLSELNHNLDVGTISHKPGYLRIALTESSQHSEFKLPSLTISEERDGRVIEGTVLEDLVIRFQAELNEKGWPERQELSYAIGALKGEYLPLTFENFLAELNWKRVQEQVEFQLILKAPTGQYMNNDFSADLLLSGKGFNYEALMLMNEKASRMSATTDEDLMLEELESMIETFITDSVTAGFDSKLERLHIDYQGLGRLRATGTGGIRAMAVEELPELTLDAWLQAFHAAVELHEVPELLRVSLLTMGIPDRDFPWLVELESDTGVIVNGKSLNE